MYGGFLLSFNKTRHRKEQRSCVQICETVFIFIFSQIFADANQKGIEKFFSMLDVHGPELDEQLFSNEIDIKEKKSTIGDLEKELKGVHRHRTISAKNYRSEIWHIYLIN